MNKYGSILNTRTWLTAAVLATFITGCSQDGIFGSDGSPAAPAGIIPGAVCTAGAGPTIPTATSSDPTSGNQFATTSTTGVAGGGKLITATFSLPMNAATINATTFTLRQVGAAPLAPAAVTYDAVTRTATLRTSAALLPDTSYTAALTTAVTSAAGTPLACAYAWTFKTVTPATAGPASINLGILSPFGIASAGGITNTGPTKINGNVVLDPNDTCNAAAVGNGDDFGACGGNPLNVPTHNVGDTVITQTHPDTTTADAVMAVLLAKWNSLLAANMPGATVLGCGTIGTGGGAGVGIGCAANATLPPGVYISATASTIDVTGDLTLNAAGDANAVWVFQVPSALTTSVTSRILLVGGAKASNVWWQVGSSATLNNGTVFQGNILASASISMGLLATSCGRLLAGAEGGGTFAFLSNTVSVPSHPNAPAGCE